MIETSSRKTPRMKKIITLALIAIASMLNAQQRCTYPVINSVYQQKVSQITTIKSDGQRLKLATEFVHRTAFHLHKLKYLPA
jgi:hypothetical protein